MVELRGAKGSSTDLRAQQKAAAAEADRPDDKQPQLQKVAAAAAEAAAASGDEGGADTPAGRPPQRAASASDTTRHSEDTTFTEQVPVATVTSRPLHAAVSPTRRHAQSVAWFLPRLTCFRVQLFQPGQHLVASMCKVAC